MLVIIAYIARVIGVLLMNNLTGSHCCYWKVLKGLDWAIELLHKGL